MDREKVAKNLEECIEHIRFNEFEKIPFWGNCQMAMTDALALLKEQEAVEPILDSFLHKRCPLCRTLLKGKYCHECGQAVKWE